MRRLTLLMSCGLLLFDVLAHAQGTYLLRDWTERASSVKTKMACADLKELTGFDFSINTAEARAATAEAPEHCYVTGQILPEIRFQLILPAAWNRRLLMPGHGGFAGSLLPPAHPLRIAALRHGFAVAFTDTGHDQVLEPLATFALNRQKVIDYAYRAVHVTTVAAKQLMQAYYEPPLSRSYFTGCSTGGRQALMSAQRFPMDFDGIVSAAPVLNQTAIHMWEAWIARALRDAPISLDKVKIIAEKVYARCDAIDGVRDGVIDDPRRCDFQPGRDLPQCPDGADAPACFTAPQIKTLQAIYGPMISNGKPIFPGLPVGAEVFMDTPKGPRSGWEGWVVSASGRTTAVNFAESFLRYMAFPKPDPNYDWTTFNFDTDPDRAAWIRSILDATNPDLSRFKARGGRLLMTFGWADPALNPLMGVDYYEQVVERMGPTTTDFFRLFMMPGVFHCAGGPGPASMDSLTPLISWVEKGKAPERLIAARVQDGKETRTRPLCAYPQVAKYKGSGSTDDAANFVCQ